MIDVGVDDARNTSLGDLRLNGQTLSRNTPLVIETDLACRGAGGEQSVELVMQEGDQEVQRSRQTVVLEPDSAQRLEFRLGALPPGVRQGAVRLLGEDSLTADNARYFTVAVEPPWRVLLARLAPAAEYTLFLSEAIAPYSQRVKGEAAFECETIAIDDLSRKSLDNYAAICLLDPTPLPASVWQQLNVHVGQGGGLGLFLGRNAGSATAFNEPAALELLPVPLLRLWKAGAQTSIWRPKVWSIRCCASSVRWRRACLGMVFPSIPIGKSAPWPMAACSSCRIRTGCRRCWNGRSAKVACC